MSLKERAIFTISCACIALQIGCASIGKDSSAGPILVRSNPPGAAVEVDGKIVATTPAYVLIDRERHPKPILLHPYPNDLSKGQTVEVPLQTRYRYGPSFGANFAFGPFAFLGWGVDFLTGAAWKAIDPDVVALKDRKPVANPDQRPILNVAIAPPLADSLALSEIAANALESKLKTSPDPRLKVRAYSDTLPIFLRERFDYDSEGSREDTRMLYYRLGVDGVYFSKIERVDGVYNVKVELRDTVTGKVVKTETLALETNDEFEKFYDKGRAFLSLLPNTVGLLLSSERMSFTVADQSTTNSSIELKPKVGNTVFDQGLEYLSAIHLSGQPVYRAGRGSRWIYSFYPTLRFSRRQLQATGSSIVDGQTYIRSLISVGYGPEAGYQFGRHYIYGAIFPTAVWSQISWERDHKENSIANTELSLSLEIGYLISFAKSWSLRTFVANYSENSGLWREALSRTSATDTEITGGSASNAVVGMVIGYNFEAAARRSFRVKEAMKAKSK